MIDRALARVPALPLCVGIVAGILVASHCGEPGWVALSTAAVGIVLLLFRFHYTGFTCLFFATAVLIAWSRSPSELPASVADGRNYRFSGRVVSDYGDEAMIVRLDSVETSCGMYPVGPFGAVIVSDFARDTLHCGQRVHLIAAVEPIRDVEDMEYVSGPYTSYIGRGAGAVAVSAAPAEIISYEGGIDSWGASCRRTIRRWLIRGGADGLAFGILEALFTASRQSLPSETDEHFRAAGIAHALALSGLHVGFIVLSASLIFFPLRAFSHHRWIFVWSVLLAVWAFAAIVGFPASVTRAAVMFTVYSLSRLLGRRSSAWNSLLLSAAIILLADPTELFSAGFQLSFAAVAGILAFAPALNPVDPRRHRVHQIMDLVAVSVAATLGTCVVTAFYFHSLPLHFIIANIFITLVLPLIMGVGLLVLLVGAFSLKFTLPALCANWLCHTTDTVTSWIAALPGLGANSLFLPCASAAALIALVVFAAVWVNHPTQRTAIVCLAASLLTVGMASFAATEPPAREIGCVHLNTNTSVVMRQGNTMVAFTTAHPRWAEKAKEDLRRNLRVHMHSRGCDSLLILDGDFVFGPFRRNGQFFTSGRRVTAVPADGRRVDTAQMHVDYVLLTMRCRADIDTVIRRMHPDTIVLAAGLTSTRRARYIQAAARASIPIIDTRARSWSPAP